jgi:hypothetical protein
MLVKPSLVLRLPGVCGTRLKCTTDGRPPGGLLEADGERRGRDDGISGPCLSLRPKLLTRKAE